MVSCSLSVWNFHVGTPTVQRHECCISWWISVIWVWRIFCLSVLSLWCTGDSSRVYPLLPKSLLGCLYRQTETEPWPWAWSLFCSSLSLSFLLYLFLLNHFHSCGNSFLKAFKLPLWTPWAIVSVSWIWILWFSDAGFSVSFTSFLQHLKTIVFSYMEVCRLPRVSWDM